MRERDELSRVIGAVWFPIARRLSKDPTSDRLGQLALEHLGQPVEEG